MPSTDRASMLRTARLSAVDLDADEQGVARSADFFDRSLSPTTKTFARVAQGERTHNNLCSGESLTYALQNSLKLTYNV